MTEQAIHADAELIARCLAQDAGAWEALLRRYQRLVASITLKFSLSPEDGADILQSVFMALFQQLPTLRKQDKLSSWIITVTVRECWKLRRRLPPTDSLDDPEKSLADSLPDAQALPEATMLALEQQQALWQGVEAMADPCRELLGELFFRAEPLPYAEISRQLAMPVASIGPTRARCLEKLKVVLKKNKFL
jgi:RNA polymerase sigma factor (sigma-70 family)